VLLLFSVLFKPLSPLLEKLQIIKLIFCHFHALRVLMKKLKFVEPVLVDLIASALPTRQIV
jgi:hypothetical protein